MAAAPSVLTILSLLLQHFFPEQADVPVCEAAVLMPPVRSDTALADPCDI